jgi:hypothetical protein
VIGVRADITENSWSAKAHSMCGLTFELTPTAEAGRLARVVQHKPARRAGKLARRSGSGAERGVRRHSGSRLSEFFNLAGCGSCWLRP